MNVQMRTEEYQGVEVGQVKVELAVLGVPAVRGLFGYASSRDASARTNILTLEIPNVYIWLNGAFDTEIVHKSAKVFEYARQMGLGFIPQNEVEEVQAYYFEMMSKLSIAEQHHANNITGIPAFAEDRHSAFSAVVSELDFDTPIEGE